MRPPNKASFGLLAVLLVCGLASCTVRPKVIHNSQASFDGNSQTSGIIGLDAAGNRIITAHARERYAALMDLYGNGFSPPAGRDQGVTATGTNTFLLDAQHAFYFETAARWYKAKMPPNK